MSSVAVALRCLCELDASAYCRWLCGRSQKRIRTSKVHVMVLGSMHRDSPVVVRKPYSALLQPSICGGESRPVLKVDTLGRAGEGRLEEGVEGADDLEALGTAGFGFGAAVDPGAPAAHDDCVEGRVIGRLRDLWRGAAGAGLGGRPPERIHASLPCRETAAAPGRC